VDLGEYCIRNRVGFDIHARAMELFQEHCESYKRLHGSCKHLSGEEYHTKVT